MATQRTNLVDVEKGLVHRKIFVDQDIYQEELEKVFGRAWLFIGHESLIPNPNDFFLTYMGEDPVILTRDAKGEVHAFLNMCRHRGNRIVRADDGNAKNFMCSYHGWTYSNEGKLVSVPGLQEAYYGELDVDNLGLVPVAHLESYAGLVFATWAEDAPTLEEYLGDMRWYMDIWFNRRDSGVELIGPDKWVGKFNWKNSTDNFIGDMYHAILSHRSALLARAQSLGVPAAPLSYSRPGNQVSPGNGHGCFAGIYDTPEDYYRRNAVNEDSPLMEYNKSIYDEMLRRLGPSRAHRIGPEHSSVFPNMSWLPNGTVRIWHPRGAGETEVWSFTFVDKAMPEELKRLWRVQCMQSFGPSGLLEQDDMDNWRNSSEAGRSLVARKTPNVISMGAGHEWDNPELPGLSVPNTFSEINQRSMYKRWQEFMDAKSWGDISIDPITATFEGTATMKG
jgi:3-phenylpropionate/trans-cinnamate dioxygenase alpha subunit